MEYTRLGGTGLKVSRIALGCMSYGDSSRGIQPVVAGRGVVAAVLPAGRRAGHHALGHRERLPASAARRSSSAGRSSGTPAGRTSSWPPRSTAGCTTARAARACPARRSWSRSTPRCARLGTDYIDLYLIHRFDPETPVEETMEALHDVVRAGKVRYLGASSMYAWQFAKLQHTADLNGWTRFVAMQDQYNLIKREEEREMLPMCLDMGVGCIPYSPQGKGRLTRPWGQQTRVPTRTPWPRASTWTSTGRSSTRCRGRRGARRADGAGGAGLGAVEAGGVRPARRRHQAAPPGGCGRRPGSRR